ncbi:MAG: ABC transporter substrate-binding protein, partial [Chloroflexota bacterium]|nr:ABC transporter substrate-binding protein [Chloroflexota bacterium]
MTLRDSLTKIARQTQKAGTAGALSAAVLLIAAFAVLSCGNDTPGATPTPTSAPNGGGQPNGAAAPPGVTADRILFGQSAAFSGPAEELGRNMRLGIEAAFNEANRNGGVHSRRLELTSRDDAYEPEAAIANTTALLEQEQVFALIGAVGTPTSRSALPVALAAGSPYIAPFTGAGFLRDPDWGNVINLRASYAQETEEMVERLTSDLGIDRIAVMYQDDSYGRAGYNGAVAALERRDMELAGVGVYTRNTTAVKTGILDMRQGSPDAVIVIGAYRPVAALVSWSRYTGWDPIFMTVSFVGSNALLNELGS